MSTIPVANHHPITPSELAARLTDATALERALERMLFEGIDASHTNAEALELFQARLRQIAKLCDYAAEKLPLCTKGPWQP